MRGLFFLFLFVHQTQTAVPQGCNQTVKYIHCPKTWIGLGNDMDCVCKKICRGVRLTCLKNGSLMERTDFREHCRNEYRNEEHTLKSGEKYKISFGKNKFTLNCKDSLTIEVGTAVCNASRISVTKYPICHLRGVCNAVQFRCTDGSCIDGNFLCDTYKDCPDGSDEKNCDSGEQCGPRDVLCGDGKCVSESVKCDVTYDCVNGVDERDCDLPCTKSPDGLKCENASIVQLNDTRNCTCLKSCTPLTISCLADGIWNTTAEYCSSHFVMESVTLNQQEFPVSSTKIFGFNNYNYFVSCKKHYSTLVEGIVTCIEGELNIIKEPKCGIKLNMTTSLDGNYSSLSSNSNNKYTIYIVALACLCIPGIAITVYFIAKKIKINHHRSTIEDDDIIYDQIDLRFTVPRPPSPPPEVPPRVHDAFGYLLVQEPYQYDVVGDEKPLAPWIKPVPEEHTEDKNVDAEQNIVGEEKSNVDAEIKHANAVQNNVDDDENEVNEKNNELEPSIYFAAEKCNVDAKTNIANEVKSNVSDEEKAGNEQKNGEKHNSNLDAEKCNVDAEENNAFSAEYNIDEEYGNSSEDDNNYIYTGTNYVSTDESNIDEEKVRPQIHPRIPQRNRHEVQSSIRNQLYYPRTMPRE